MTRTLLAALVIVLLPTAGAGATPCAAVAEMAMAEIEATLPLIANFHEALKAQATMSERSQVNIDRAMNAARAHGERRTKSRLLRDYRKSLELAAQQIRLLSIMARRDADFVIHFTKVLRTAIAALRQIHRAGCTVQ